MESTTKQDFIAICKDADMRYYCDKQILSDYKNIDRLKKLLSVYQYKGIIDEKLLINYIIILNNIYTLDVLEIIFERLFNDFEKTMLKSVLVFLNNCTLLPSIKPNKNILDILHDSNTRNHILIKLVSNLQVIEDDIHVE